MIHTSVATSRLVRPQRTYHLPDAAPSQHLWEPEMGGFFKRVPYGKWSFDDEFMDDLPSGTGDFNGYVSWNQRVHHAK